jgi:hypothetical protein
MSLARRVVAAPRDAADSRLDLEHRDPLAATIRDWLVATIAAPDPELARRLDGIARCLRLFAAGRRRSLAELAADQRLLNALHPRGDAARTSLHAHRDALAAALARAPTHLAALGLVDLDAPVVPSSTPSLADANAVLAAHEAAHAGPRRVAREIDVDELVCLFDARLRAATGRWIDLGSGDGVSLARLAARSAAREIVATDVAWSYSLLAANHRRDAIAALPPHCRYMVFGSAGGPAGIACELVAIGEPEFRYADLLAETMLRALGPRSCDVVTLLYPMHMPVPTRNGPRMCAELVLDTALTLLRGGGIGLVITESTAAWRGLVRVLLDHDRVAGFDHLAAPVSARQLRELGIEPYTPSAAELDANLGARFTRKAVAYDESFAPAHPFAWGLPLIFTVRD